MILVIFKIIFIVVLGYLFGSIPTGYLIVKKLKGIDIRQTGSGSTGATNVKRILGTKWFYVVMLLDALKGFLPVVIASIWFDFMAWYGLTPVLTALAAIIGHSKSIFLGFTGGKSVATGVGTLIGLCWPVGLIVAIVWGAITFTSKYVSLGSVVALVIAPILMSMFNQSLYEIYYTAICAIYVVVLHKDNIKRLLEGKENKVRK